MGHRVHRSVPQPGGGARFCMGYVLGHTANAPGTEVYFDNLQVSPNK